jgi:hypothetical protein
VSGRKRQQREPDKFPLPTNVPLHWSPDWRFKMFPDHVRFAFGHSGVMHDLIGLPLNEAVALHQQLGQHLAAILTKPEEPKE